MRITSNQKAFGVMLRRCYIYDAYKWTLAFSWGHSTIAWSWGMNPPRPEPAATQGGNDA